MKQLPIHVIKFCLVALTLISVINSRAQYVTIPDAHFVSWLSSNGYASCMSGNQLDTTCTKVLNSHGLYCSAVPIRNLTGIQYFKNLDTLDCNTDSLTLIPSFPSLIRYIDCSHNQLSSLPALPASLTYLNCQQNGISALLSLPGTLIQLICSFNHLSALPALPASLTQLYCNYNNISTLPALPSNIQNIDCSENSLSTIPVLPNSMQQLSLQANQVTALPPLSGTALNYLNCIGNLLDSVPIVPATLQTLLCSSNHITNLPAFPAGLLTLACDGNRIDSLLPLPNGLQLLNCGMNNIAKLPVLPRTLTTLWCNQNRLTELPELPDSLDVLNCYFNQYLTCLPQLKRIVSFQFYNCGVTCLPNYGRVTTSNPALNTLPLCGIFNTTGCSSYNDLSGQVFYDANNDCFYDDTDKPLPNVKVALFSNGNLLQQTYTGSSGDYTFQAPNGHYVVRVDTTGFPFQNTCQQAGWLNDTLSSADSVSFGKDFAFVCRPTGFDLGVKSILNGNTIPSPSNLITINTVAGDMSALNNARCASGIGGQVLLTFTGPVTYVGAANGAVAPSSTGTDSVTWNIADFDSLNINTAFNTLFRVNANAIAGSPICFTAAITPTTGDINAANNSLTYCFNVDSSTTVAVKEVYPTGLIDSTSQWLTYTIRFRNTGNDTDQNILITDTLDPDLNPYFFELLNASAKNITQLFGNIVKFNFPNIKLPNGVIGDSTNSGYVQYRIKTDGNMQPGTLINNTASVYFNLVNPVSTNTVTDTVKQYPVSVQTLSASTFEVRLYPNPAGNKLNIELAETGTYNLKLFDIQGKLLYAFTTGTGTNAINVSSLAPGLYIAEITKGEITQRVRWVKM